VGKAGILEPFLSLIHEDLHREIIITEGLSRVSKKRNSISDNFIVCEAALRNLRQKNIKYFFHNLEGRLI